MGWLQRISRLSSLSRRCSGAAVLVAYLVATIPPLPVATSSRAAPPILQKTGCCCGSRASCCKHCCCSQGDDSTLPNTSERPNDGAWITGLDVLRCQGGDLFAVGAPVAAPPPGLVTWGASDEAVGWVDSVVFSPVLIPVKPSVPPLDLHFFDPGSRKTIAAKLCSAARLTMRFYFVSESAGAIHKT